MRLVHLDEEIGLDSPAPLSFVSHAHSDHLAGARAERVLASRETLELAGLEKQCANIPGARLADAGHILGARQLVLENTEKIVYTGDFSLKPNIFGFRASIEECDRLIMESTYFSPEYRFEDPFSVYDEIKKWMDENEEKNVVIGAYELGKAQDIIRVLNEYCGIAPIVTEKTDRFCRIYESFGFKLDRIKVESEEAAEAMEHGFVAVVPPRIAKRTFAKKLEDAFGRKAASAIATGWALKFRYNADRAFALSNHADFDDLAFYIEQSGASSVEFFDNNALAANMLSRIKAKEGMLRIKQTI